MKRVANAYILLVVVKILDPRTRVQTENRSPMTNTAASLEAAAVRCTQKMFGIDILSAGTQTRIGWRSTTLETIEFYAA